MGETAHHAGESADRIVMAEQPLAVRPCSVAAALDILGERWSLLAVREIGYGVHTFAKIAGYTGASRDILADRLRQPESAGIIERRPYSEHPPRDEYHLTQAGREPFPGGPGACPGAAGAPRGGRQVGRRLPAHRAPPRLRPRPRG